MQITVKLNGPLKKYLSGTDTLVLQPSCDVSELLSLLGLPGTSVSLLVVNGEKATLGQVLKDGDHVSIYPPVCGG